MALPNAPRIGAVVQCDFDAMGLFEPEMIKKRDVVVVARNKHHSKLVTVVPLSSTPPLVAEDYHHKLAKNPRPDEDPKLEIWAKCDHIFTLSIDRLNFRYRKTKRGREWLYSHVSSNDVQKILAAVAASLNLHQVSKSTPQVNNAVAFPIPLKSGDASPNSVT